MKKMIYLIIAIAFMSCEDGTQKSVVKNPEKAAEIQVIKNDDHVMIFKIKIDSVDYVVVRDWYYGGVAIIKHQ